MANTAVLIGGTLVRTTGFSNMTFNHKDGYLVRFTYDTKTYIHITKVNFRIEDNETVATAGYFEELPFLRYRVREIKPENIASYQLEINSIEKGVIGDTIVVQKLKIKGPSYTDFCKVDSFSWLFTGGALIDGQGIILIPTSTVPTSKTIAMHSIATQFYQRNITFVSSLPSDKRRDSAYLLALSAIQINNIQITVFPLFTGNATLESYIQAQNTEWTNRDAFKNPSVNDFKQYFANVTAFYNITYANQLAIQKANAKTKLFWLVYVLSAEALAILPVLSKIEILENLCYGTLLEGSAIIELIMLSPVGGFSVVPVVNQEEMALKIVKSVLSAPLQIDEFLARLISNYDGNDGSTLFEILYKKVDDEGGSDNLKTMMDALYRIWASSSLYPYNLDGTVKNNLINDVIYANKPIDIGYESGTVAFFFNSSNYDFSFKKYEIIVIEPKNIIMEHGSYIQNVLIGIYDIYQSISINSKDPDIGSSTFTFVEVEKENNQVDQLSVLPIFYLKYLDDKKRTENLKTGISLTVDVVLTLSGVGNLGKLRHLRSVYKLGRVALGLEPLVPGTVLASFEFARGVIGVVEITASIGSIFIQYGNQIPTYCTIGSPTYNKDKCEFYTKLNGWFLALQILAPTLDFATSKLISNSAKKILEGPIPNDFDPDALGILRKFAGENIIELKQIFKDRLTAKFGENSPIWSKLQQLGSAKQEEFIMDFGKAENRVLEALNDDDDLIDYWRQITGSEAKKREIRYLENFRLFKSSTKLDAEVFKGIVEFKDPGWIAKGVHYKSAILEGSAKIKEGTLIEPIGPAGLGYYEAKIEVYNPLFPENNGWKTKSHPSTFFPDAWTKEKVQEEVALALSNRIFKYVRKQDGMIFFKGTMSDGVECAIWMDKNGTITTVHPSFK